MTTTPRQDTPPNGVPAPDELVQMNVRIPRHLRDEIDARRAQVRNGLSQSHWVANAARFALDYAPAAAVLVNSVGRTAPPPSRRDAPPVSPPVRPL